MGDETDMNYIREINAFYDWLETNELSVSAISLWYALMHINNKTGWKNEFTVALSVLSIKSGLSSRAVTNARKELTEKGRIKWESRNGNQAAQYSINSLMEELQESYADKVADNNTDKQTCKLTGNDTDITSTLTKHKLNINRNNSPKKNIEFPSDSQEYILAQYLLDKILENNPSSKLPNLNNWAKSMDMILRVDKRTAEEVKAVIDFCQTDSFWKSNILSVEKLRKQYDQLNIKRRSQKEPKKEVVDQVSIFIDDDELNSRWE